MCCAGDWLVVCSVVVKEFQDRGGDLFLYSELDFLVSPSSLSGVLLLTRTRALFSFLSFTVFVTFVALR